MPNLNFPKSGSNFYFPHSSISDILDDKPVAIGLGILVIGLIALLLHSPGPAEYTITSEGVTIHGGSFSDTLNAAGIDVEHIQIVDLGKDTHWRPTSQFGISGHSARYRTGYWRVAGGEKVLLYQAGGKRLVLLPPKGKGNPVLLEVKKPEVFIQELRQAWR